MARKKTRSAANLGQMEREYTAVLPIAQRFCAEVAHQIEDLLRREQIALSFPIQHRVKTWSSIVDKLQRVGLQLQNLRELQDLVGFRLILQFVRDISRVGAVLGRTFKVIEQYDTRDRLKEDQFGYASLHLVVELPESWLALPSLSDMGGIRTEIQIRTTAQHTWAAASHYLQYKTEDSVPPPVRRAIYRVSALLETVDLELERVLTEREKYKSPLRYHRWVACKSSLPAMR